MRASGNELINPFKVMERAGIAPGQEVADLGCGALGHFVFPAAQMVGGDGRVYAVDIDKQALKAIERTAKFEQFWNVFPIWSDIEVLHATRVRGASLDLTILANNLYLCRNRTGAVAEAIRLTRPGGRILVIEWQACKTVIGPAEEHRLSPEDAKAHFMAPEVELIDEFEAGDCHYALVYRKQETNETKVLSVNHSS